MVSLNVLGLNCGTSIDGVDVVHCRISSVDGTNDVKIDILSYTEVAVDAKLRSQVLRLCRPNQDEAATNMAEVCDLNFALGREFSRAVKESGVNMEEVDIIASHGQTLWHQPLGEHRSTLQMAEPAVIARQSGRTVVSDFRVAELAAGRQGAPLSGFFEAAFLSHPDVTRISQNIGGMGNATVLPASSSSSDKSTYLAFDTGPGNVFIDATMRILTNGEQNYDQDGKLGLQGESDIDTSFVDEYLASEPYFNVQPPKTTGRELFSDDVARSLVEKLKSRGKSNEAIVATITRITAESIARAYEQFVMPQLKEGKIIDEIYVCGGGAYNPNIMNHLRRRFPQSKVQKFDGIAAKMDPSAKEAVLFALLGYLAVCGRTVPISATSETQTPAILGCITPGDNYRDVMRSVIQDSSFATNGVLGRVVL